MVTLDDYVVDVLMRDLVGHDRKPASFLVCLAHQRAGAQTRRCPGELSGTGGIDRDIQEFGASRRWLVDAEKTARGQQGECDGNPSDSLRSACPLHAACITEPFTK